MKDILENVELNYFGAVYTVLVLTILTTGLNLPSLDLSHRPDAARAVQRYIHMGGPGPGPSGTVTQ